MYVLKIKIIENTLWQCHLVLFDIYQKMVLQTGCYIYPSKNSMKSDVSINIYSIYIHNVCFSSSGTATLVWGDLVNDDNLDESFCDYWGECERWDRFTLPIKWGKISKSYTSEYCQDCVEQPLLSRA